MCSFNLDLICTHVIFPPLTSSKYQLVKAEDVNKILIKLHPCRIYKLFSIFKINSYLGRVYQFIMCAVMTRETQMISIVSK